MTSGTQLSAHVRTGHALLTEALRTNGGFTYNPRTGELVNDGYAVGMGRTGQAVKFVADAADITEGDLAAVVLANYELLTAKDSAMLGGWVNGEGRAEIEPSWVVASREAAVYLAQTWGEEAVGDLAAYARGEDGTIYVNREG